MILPYSIGILWLFLCHRSPNLSYCMLNSQLRLKHLYVCSCCSCYIYSKNWINLINVYIVKWKFWSMCFYPQTKTNKSYFVAEEKQHTISDIGWEKGHRNSLGVSRMFFLYFIEILSSGDFTGKSEILYYIYIFLLIYSTECIWWCAESISRRILMDRHSRYTNVHCPFIHRQWCIIFQMFVGRASSAHYVVVCMALVLRTIQTPNTTWNGSILFIYYIRTYLCTEVTKHNKINYTAIEIQIRCHSNPMLNHIHNSQWWTTTVWIIHWPSHPSNWMLQSRLHSNFSAFYSLMKTTKQKMNAIKQWMNTY